jgi:hypothetical protein
MSYLGTVVPGVGTMHAAGGIVATLQATAASFGSLKAATYGGLVASVLSSVNSYFFQNMEIKDLNFKPKHEIRQIASDNKSPLFLNRVSSFGQWKGFDTTFKIAILLYGISLLVTPSLPFFTFGALQSGLTRLDLSVAMLAMLVATCASLSKTQAWVASFLTTHVMNSKLRLRSDRWIANFKKNSRKISSESQWYAKQGWRYIQKQINTRPVFQDMSVENIKVDLKHAREKAAESVKALVENFEAQTVAALSFVKSLFNKV